MKKENARYWDIKKEEGNGKQTAVFKLKVDKDLGKKIKDCNSQIRECEKKIKELKGTEGGTDKTQIYNEISEIKDEIRKKNTELQRLEEREELIKKNMGMELKLYRLKDKYSRKESLLVVVFREKKEDGRVISVISKPDDIHKLVDYGVYFTPRCYDELVELIKDTYYDIKASEQSFVDNDVPLETVKAFAKMCYEHIDQNDKQDNVTMNEAGSCYYVPVKTFDNWYKDSDFQRFSASSLKEALIIHEFAKGNTGRNDYTAAKIGKVVCLLADKRPGGE